MAKSKKPAGSYAVGKGKPPVEHRFKPGQSGNPSGRPKAPPNAQEVFVKQLHQVVKVTVNGKTVQMTKLEVTLRRLLDNAMQGDFKAANLVFFQALALSTSNAPDVEKQEPLTDAEIDAMNLIKKLGGGNGP